VPVSDSAKPVASNDLLVLAIDQGTSATKCIVVGEGGSLRRRASVAIDQQHPQPGWAEQDPDGGPSTNSTSVAAARGIATRSGGMP
jgi:glycerol kinase